MRMPLQRLLLSGSLAATLAVQALVLNVTDDGSCLAPSIWRNSNIGTIDSIRSTAATIAHNMMSYYTGNQTGSEPGGLPPPYYWWEAGAMWGSMVEYWHYTGDTSYNDVVSQAILTQASPTNDFMMPEEAGQLVRGYAMLPLHQC